MSTFVKEPENTAQITQILADAPTTGVEFLADPTLNFSEQIAPALQARTYRYLPAFDASIPAAGAAGIAKATKLANESVTFDLSDTQSLNLAKAGGYNENIVSSNAFYPNAALTYTPAAYTPAHTSGLPTDVFRYDQSLADALAGVLPGTTATGTRDSAGTLSALDSRQLALTVAAMQYRERPNDQRGIIAAFERGTTLDLATAKLSSTLRGPNPPRSRNKKLRRPPANTRHAIHALAPTSSRKPPWTRLTRPENTLRRLRRLRRSRPTSPRSLIYIRRSHSHKAPPGSRPWQPTRSPGWTSRPIRTLL